MKFVIHNLLDGSAQTYEGDTATVERELEEKYPWAVEGHEGHLEAILWNIDHQQFHSVEMIDSTQHPFLGKAMSDVPAGLETEAGGTDYTHLLSENLRNSGYRLRAYDELDESGIPKTQMAISVPYPGETEKRYRVGDLMGFHSPNKGFRIIVSGIDRAHRNKGLGLAMYEAALKHAKDKHGTTFIVGGSHSSMAKRMHEKIAQKHGLNYQAKPNVRYYGTRSEWNEVPAGSFDNKWRSYLYTLKHEDADIEDVMSDFKKEEKLVVPPRYMKKHERNLKGWEEVQPFEHTAMEQAGLRSNLSRYLNAASYLVGRSEDSFNLGTALRLLDDEPDMEAAALSAYGIPVTEQTRMGLDLVLRDDLAKADMPGLVSYKITPARPEATSTADAVQRGIDSGYLNPVKLSGKHSRGAMIVKDPETKKVYLLKPGSGRNSPAKGVSEVRASQSEREAAFYHVADYVGVGDAYPRADLVLVNNHQTAAMELLPLSYKNLGTKKREDKSLPLMILEPYRANGTLFKWSFLDYILGNPDRHSQNMMVDPENRTVRLIDHGSALAGQSFDPADDANSFIPYYLRAWTSQKFAEMMPEDRIRFMPGVGDRVSTMFDEWVNGINEHHIAEILRDYNVDPSAILDRIAQIRSMPGPKWAVLNKLWAGAM